MAAYINNHYVPQWYQRRFLPACKKQRELFYLDLQPESWVDESGVRRCHRPMTHRTLKKCFAEPNLYTTRLSGRDSVDIEKFFFGEIDASGMRAVETFSTFAHQPMDTNILAALLHYMSAQKLRTPKGLSWLFANTPARTKNELLKFMVEIHDVHAAIWCECVWQIADASMSSTKFIISDHPVTVYNRDCPPDSEAARGHEDPDIRWHGTHTIFPLSADKVLILTNLSWIRNPYQSARDYRPNSQPFRGAMFDFLRVQLYRQLSEADVKTINLIIKRRAFRFVAAAEEEWLFPESDGRIQSWREIGDSHVLMPDPRSVEFTGRVIVGHGNGSYSSWDEYGNKPGQRGFDDGERSRSEYATFHRFIGEFARRFGPQRRGRAIKLVHLDPERDDDVRHNVNLRYETEYDRFLHQ